MSRSHLVFAAADGVSGAVPSCVEDSTTLCAQVYDWFGLDADGIRTPLPLLTGSAGAAAGVR